MRIRATAVTTAAVASLLLAPFSAPAHAVTTTSTIVAYVTDTNDNGILEMYTRPADGSGSPTRTFSNTKDVLLPSLSPDGTKLAYLGHAVTVDGRPHFYLYVRTISPTVSAPTLLLAKDVTASVAWSKDGTKLVASAVDWTTFTFGTYVVNADGSGSPTLVPGTDEEYSEEPSFSPSGTQVALDGFTDDGDYAGIDLVTLETGKRARIAGTTGGSDPVWSPDGQHILFQKELPSCGVGLYRVPAGGGTPVAIREVPGRFLGSHEYSRDGTQIFFADAPFRECGTTTPLSDIWLMNADGSGATQVAVTPDWHESGISVAGGTPAPDDTTPPAAPVINAMGTVGPTSAVIGWTAEGDATDFVVLRKNHGDPAPTSTTDGTLVYHGPAHSARATGLATDVSYDLYVFAIDSSGNTSPVSLVHPVHTLPRPVMRAIPRVGTATANTTFTVRWLGSATSYQGVVGERKRVSSVRYSADPVYTTWFASTTAKSQTFTGNPGHSYYFKVRGVDEFGNVTLFASPPSAAHVPLDDRWRAFSLTAGAWVDKTSSSRYLGTYRTTITSNARMTAATDTDRFVIIGDRCATCGRFQVYIDGVLRTTVDSYASTTRVRQVLYASRDLGAISRHRITIVTLRTAGRPRVSIDALAIRR